MDEQSALWERVAQGTPIPRLYGVLDLMAVEGRGLDLFDVAKAWRDAGVKLVQYRDKLSPSMVMIAHAVRLAEIFRGTDTLLVLNDSPAMARDAGLCAAHLGQTDGTVEAARRAVPYIGVSTNTERQIRTADGAACTYIAIGPVFETRTKVDAKSAVGLAGVRSARALTKKPLVAIGGIKLENAASVLEAGADSVAVISALLEGGNPVTQARAFLRIVE
ncbi:thiamine phosphate synthase [Terriglobus saanensis]|uniref:Thiamine-phosphate synthase n=1 Tax=Terriglobus saanensis (strain ATCC BAA-1853 / DSM 23119 / SP1PR4) TaxID=401053 RepID=E8V7C9_TERSS|nr:thiamine phosphate synthase [Terriglobus saanensis]ADV82842.1 Thiamine-phosphate diphosphorylase [Terriglobus saanensis SP1PR4]